MTSISDILTIDRIVLFDGVCNLCNGAVQFLIRRDRKGLLKYASLQSGLARELIASAGVKEALPDSIVFFDEGKLYTESDAVLRICRYLPQPWRSLSFFRFLPKGIRNTAYRIIARHRYAWFGKRDQCMIPAPGIRERFPDGGTPE